MIVVNGSPYVGYSSKSFSTNLTNDSDANKLMQVAACKVRSLRPPFVPCCTTSHNLLLACNAWHSPSTSTWCFGHWWFATFQPHVLQIQVVHLHQYPSVFYEPHLWNVTRGDWCLFLSWQVEQDIHCRKTLLTRPASLLSASMEFIIHRLR